MKPERGNPRLKLTDADIVSALRDIGVNFGEVVFFHSSLSRLGLGGGWRGCRD